MVHVLAAVTERCFTASLTLQTENKCVVCVHNQKRERRQIEMAEKGAFVSLFQWNCVEEALQSPSIKSVYRRVQNWPCWINYSFCLLKIILRKQPQSNSDWHLVEKAHVVSWKKLGTLTFSSFRLHCSP